MVQFLLKLFLSLLSLFGFARGFKKEFHCNGIAVNIVRGDIVSQNDVDAIVNAANQSLKQGGGVCGAIFAKAGKLLKDECDKIIKKCSGGKVPVGSCVITDGGNLKQQIIHVVAPNFNFRNSMQKSIAFDYAGKKLLKKSYGNLLRLANQKGVASIAVPFLSGGNFCRRPSDRDELAKIALKAVFDFCNKDVKRGILKEIRFVLFSDLDFNLFVNTVNTFKIR